MALLATLVYSFSQGDVNWDTVGDYMFDDRILDGHAATRC